MMGIDHVEKSSNGIIIHFINKDELNIIIKHDKIENARVSHIYFKKGILYNNNNSFHHF